MKQIILLVVLLFCVVSSEAQGDLRNEAFKFRHVAKQGAHSFVYDGKQHSFCVNIPFKDVKYAPGGDSNFVLINNLIVQSSIVTMPLSNDKTDAEINNFLTQIDSNTAKAILQGYVDYELEYMRDDLHVRCINVVEEWRTASNKLWLVWSFDTPGAGEETSNSSIRQIYVSTYCFNQIYSLNTPILQDTNEKQAYESLMKLIGNFHQFNFRYRG